MSTNEYDKYFRKKNDKTTLQLFIRYVYNLTVLAGTAYLVGWQGWSAWWFLFAVLVMANINFTRINQKDQNE